MSPGSHPATRAGPPRRTRSARWGPRWLWRGVLLITVLPILEHVVLPQLAHAGQTVNLLAHVSAPFLAAGVILEVASLFTFSVLTRAVLPARNRPPLATLIRIDLTTLGLSHVVPGGGRSRQRPALPAHDRAGISRPDAVFGTVVEGVGSAIVLNAVLLPRRQYLLSVGPGVLGRQAGAEFRVNAGITVVYAGGGGVPTARRGHRMVARGGSVRAERLDTVDIQPQLYDVPVIATAVTRSASCQPATSMGRRGRGSQGGTPEFARSGVLAPPRRRVRSDTTCPSANTARTATSTSSNAVPAEEVSRAIAVMPVLFSWCCWLDAHSVPVGRTIRSGQVAW